MPVSREYILAGDATFTVEMPEGSKTPHVTYWVQYVEPTDDFPGEKWFVKIFTGTDNSKVRHYTYAGKLDTFTGQLVFTSKRPFKEDDFRIKLFNKVLARIWCDDHAAYEQHGYRTHHCGRCGRCGKKLTTPESVERGIGPECWKVMSKDGQTQEVEDEVPVETLWASDGVDTRGMEVIKDEEGDTVAWEGVQNGRKVVIYNS